MKKIGFTLAEVLITLGIIGVVAAITLPLLTNGNKNLALQSQLKKGYSEIEQALNMYYAENGEKVKLGDFACREFKDIIMPYFKNAQDCGLYGKNKNACLEIFIDGREDDVAYRNYNNTNYAKRAYIDDGQFLLFDGSLILLENCSELYISIDINGYNKKPNRLGQDLFMFQITSDGKLLPMGAKGTDYYSEDDLYCSKTSTLNMNGAGCTYKALSEDDYFKNMHK